MCLDIKKYVFIYAYIQIILETMSRLLFFKKRLRGKNFVYSSSLMWYGCYRLFFLLKHILAHAKYHPNYKWLVNIFYIYFINVDKFRDSLAVLLLLPRSCGSTSSSTAILWQYLYFYHNLVAVLLLLPRSCGSSSTYTVIM